MRDREAETETERDRDRDRQTDRDRASLSGGKAILLFLPDCILHKRTENTKTKKL